MFEHHIVEMVTALVGGGIIPDEIEDKQGAHDILRGCWCDKIAFVWGVEDVMVLDQSLTKDEAREILHETLNEADASIGINWDVIETRVSEFNAERSKQR